MDQRFTVVIQALENLAQDKCKYREEEHSATQTCDKRARTLVEYSEISTKTSVESPEEQKELSHQLRDDNFIENSSDTRRYGISDEKEFQEECIIPVQQNLADEIQQLFSGR